MHPARIAELLEPFLGSAATPNHFHSEPGQRPGPEPAFLTPAQLQHISTYIDILLRWNVRINLTAIRDPEDIVPRHFGESLFAARHLFPQRTSVAATELRQIAAHGTSPGSTPGSDSAPEGQKRLSIHNAAPPPRSVADDHRSFLACPEQSEGTNDPSSVADVGSGAGFPGIPLKLWAPQIALTLIESNHKKATFLREVTRAITLTDVNIQAARAETLSGSQFDVVTLRAVEGFASILPTAASLVAPGGRLALLISSAQSETARSSLPRLIWNPPIQIPSSRTRILLPARCQ
jgi:16S rRNA (guanine(527)-N(7))-methyltransferase RsmG